MAAHFVDALKGYEHFMEKRGKVSLEHVNKFLESINRNPISERTYSHYHSLMAQGFPSYLPINQFDVSRTLGKLQIAADRRRYSRERTRVMSMISSDRETWIPATIIDESLVGFGMKAPKLQFKLKNPIWVRIDQYRDIPVILVWKHREENLIRFGVRSLEFIAKYRISEEKILLDRLTGLLIVKKNSGGGITWKEFYRIMEKIGEMIDSASSLLGTIAKIAKRDVRLASPVLSFISFGSPVNIQVKLDFDAAKMAGIAIEKAQLWKLEKERYKAETRGFELQNSLREIEVLRNAVNFRKEALESGMTQEMANFLFGSAIMKFLNIDYLPFPIFEQDSLESGILNDRLLPAATELVAGDDPDIEVEIKSDSDNHENMTKGNHERSG